MQEGMDDLGSVSNFSFSFYWFIFKNAKRRVDLNIKIEFLFLHLFSVIRVALRYMCFDCFLIY